MAVLSFGVSGPTMNFTTEMQIQDQDAPRILQYLGSSHYGKKKVLETQTVDGVETQVEVEVNCTVEETARNFAAGILRGLLDQTVSYERQKAAQEAMANIQGIDPV